MNILNVQNLHKSFGTRTLFSGVSFAIDEGEKVGFIGANGSGKWTLFRVVAGEEGMEAGSIALKRDASVGYLAQEPVFAPGDTIRSAVSAGHPEMEEALRDYHLVSERITAGEGEAKRLLARQAELLGRIDALGGWEWEHQVERLLTHVDLEDWDCPVEGLICR